VSGSAKVAVIGPADLVERAIAAGRGLPGLEIVPLPYESSDQAATLCAKAEAVAEAILFTGPLGYRRATVRGRPRLPTAYVSYSPLWLYVPLFKVEDRAALSRVSLDTVDREALDDTYRELGLSLEVLAVCDLREPLDPVVVADFHADLARRGKTRHALTGLYAVYRLLREREVPCTWLVPPGAVIRQALESLLQQVAEVRARGAQIVVGLARLGGIGDRSAPFEARRARLRAYELLLSLVEELDGHLVDCGGEDFEFFTTRAPLERVTALYTSWPLGLRLGVAGLRLGVGIGLGQTAAESGEGARLALEEALRRGGGGCFVMLEGHRLVGPLGDGSLTYDVRTTDRELVETARRAGSAAASLERALAAAGDLNGAFTARDLASRLRVGLRTSHRVLRRLADAGYVEEVGQESIGSRGRPRRVFRVAARRPGRRGRGGSGSGGTGTEV
jgi:hypothetical protein